MKILILSEFVEGYTDGASSRVRYRTALKIAESGHDVTFIYPSGNSKYRAYKDDSERLTVYLTPGILPSKFRSGGFGIIDTIFKCVMVLKYDYDAIQVTNGHRPAQFLPAVIGKYFKQAVIVDECWEWLGKGGYADSRKGFFGKIVSLYDALFELRLKRYFDEIITISSALKERFKEKDNVTVLYGGAENDLLIDYDIKHARSELGLEQNAFILGMSNVCPSDHDDNVVFFTALKKIMQQNGNVFLLLTGTDKNYINEIGLTQLYSDRIIFPGWTTFELYNKYMSSCNAFVLPFTNTIKNNGRWPNKIGDYLCLNRPIITNPTGDMMPLFTKYKIGFLCDDSEDGFYNVVTEILGRNKSLTEYHSDSIYVARQILSFDKRVNRLLEIIEGRLDLKS